MTNPLYDALIAPHLDNSNTFLILDDGREISFAAFAAMVAQTAQALTLAGVSPGDRIVVQAPKTVAMLAVYGAAALTGTVFLPLNTAYTAEELSYFITDATPRLVVCTNAGLASIEPIAAAVGATVLTLEADESGTLMQSVAAQAPQFQTVARSDDDLAALLYTSGTTGRSKGAMLSHANLLSNARALQDLWQITSDDRLIHALPIFHTHGLFVAMNTALLAGTAVRLMARFDPDLVFAELPHATMMMGVPTFYTRLLDDPRLTRNSTAGMRLFVSGSAPLLAETHDAFRARTGHAVLERYGMTETNMITSNPYDGERIAGTVGMPLHGVEVRLTDPDTATPVERGAVGMIEVRGPNVFKGYWNMPGKTAAELRADGFFITGDLGQFNPQGYLQIVGRLKDLIISGGYNIYPKEIEDVLNDAPGVVETAVFGIADPDFGEAVIAAVVMESDVVCDEAALGALVKEKLARFKHPRRYVVLSDLPRNTMGKVQKNLLRDQFA